MYYGFIDQNGKFHIAPFRVKKAEDYREFYAHAAAGGFMANYHFRIDFYNDAAPALEYTDEEGRGSPPPDSLVKNGVDRRVMASVYVSPPFLKELATWLNNMVQEHEAQYGPIQPPKTFSPPSEGQKEGPK